MPTTKTHPKKKDKKSKKRIVFGHALLSGYVPIPKGQEITIDTAIEAVEAVSKRSIKKPYKCKVFDSVTYLVVRRKNVVDTGKPWKLRVPYLEIYRYFIFARDPCLVVLVIPEKTSGYLAYLMLTMETPAQASAICDAIQKRRQGKLGDSNSADKRITSQVDEATCVDSVSKFSAELSRAKNNDAYQQEAPRPVSMEQTRVEAQRSAAPLNDVETEDSQTECKQAPRSLEELVKPSKKELQNSAVPFNYDSAGEQEDSETDSEDDEDEDDEDDEFDPAELMGQTIETEEIPAFDASTQKVSTTSGGVQYSENGNVEEEEEREDEAARLSRQNLKTEVIQADEEKGNENEAARLSRQNLKTEVIQADEVPPQRACSMLNRVLLSESEDEEQDKTESSRQPVKTNLIQAHEVAPQRACPGIQSGSRIERRDPPLIVEMPVGFLGDLDESPRDDVKGMEALKQSMLGSKLDKNWAYDMKVVKSDGNYCSHISDEGNVFMFAAHHLVPENYGLVEVSEDESEDYMARSKKRSDSSDSALLTSSSSASSRLPTSAHQNSDMKSVHPLPTTITSCY